MNANYLQPSENQAKEKEQRGRKDKDRSKKSLKTTDPISFHFISFSSNSPPSATTSNTECPGDPGDEFEKFEAGGLGTRLKFNMAAEVPLQPAKKTLSKNLMGMKVMHPYIPQDINQVLVFDNALRFIIPSS